MTPNDGEDIPDDVLSTAGQYVVWIVDKCTNALGDPHVTLHPGLLRQATVRMDAYTLADMVGKLYGMLRRSELARQDLVSGRVGMSTPRHNANVARELETIRQTVAAWIYDANSGDDTDASDLMWELEQAGVPLTVELDAIEAQRNTA